MQGSPTCHWKRTQIDVGTLGQWERRHGKGKVVWVKTETSDHLEGLAKFFKLRFESQPLHNHQVGDTEQAYHLNWLSALNLTAIIYGHSRFNIQAMYVY
jgi:hypothetical protein